ncbi:MAG: 4Fe-4S binding protein [Rhodobacter sp.]|nr:4Fe-4S binding protein [Rhodobacter sp.]
MTNKIILCDCANSQRLNPSKIAASTGAECSPVHTSLCTEQSEIAAKAIREGGCTICCGQEMRFFEQLAEELGAEVPAFIDLRDRAGWTDDDNDTGPKMAALVAEAILPPAPTKTIDVVSEGVCLIVGSGETVFDAAERLADTHAVTVLQLDESDPPPIREFDVIRGRLRKATGALGGFQLSFDNLRRIQPAGRGIWQWTNPRDSAHSECDIILDLSGQAPLFSAHEKREGYLRADPGSMAACKDAVFDAAKLIGTFEKPLYTRVEPILCAHSRASQVGCSRCLDSCPTGAIVPEGEHVTVDPMICAGCGACSSLCPSGAISYDAPPVEHSFRRIQTLAKAFLDAGGVDPRLLVVDERGSELIRLSARYGRGLPADVVPLEMPAVGAFGHAETLAALAAGFSSVAIVPGAGADMALLNHEIALAAAICGDRVALVDTSDADQLSDTLFDADVPSALTKPVRPMGTRRQIARQAAKALCPDTAEPLPLPAGAPYGAILVNSDACTLCLSCVSLCPSGALGDNPDLPQLRFQEDACLQCGLCAKICPEDAIALAPRLNLGDEALSQVVLNEEEPFACIECGCLFGSKSTIERITDKLSSHSMYQGEGALRMIQMCDDCRVNAQFLSHDSPLAMGERPRVRTTDDYLSKRRDH